MSSSRGNVGFDNAARGRSGRVPLSLYMPVINNSPKPFYKVMPQNAVPTGKGNTDEQIGYWNEQVRWRMVRGVRKDLPSKWHFYYLGTGPHSDLAFRTRQQGVYWVAKEHAKTAPTGLGSRGRNTELIKPVFSTPLPNEIEIVETNSRPNSRASSRARSQSNDQNRSRSQSRNRSQTTENARSQSRGRQQNNQSRNNDQNGSQRSQSRGRSNSRNRGNQQQQQQQRSNQQDVVAAVRQALAELGFSKQNNSGKGNRTPRDDSNQQNQTKKQKQPVNQTDKPVWKRTPHSQENAELCFGPRDTYQNFGDSQLVRLGVDYPHYPQIAELIPSQAAMLFGSEITAHEVGDHIQLTYVYKMQVSKDNKSLIAFLPHICAYAYATEDVTAQSTMPPLERRLTRSISVEQFEQTNDSDTVEEDQDERVEFVDHVYDEEASA
ncbi:nucleocapsid protein [Alphacoronavirus Bat-CoV/P.kuhlii/Italy/206645-41/2011]|nr:nucleocapsid protein [Alphacoronavirus Bat-CoV/P.kuhlii/Italy/206645-41/2011]